MMSSTQPTLTSFDPIDVMIPNYAATPQEINAELEKIARKFATYEPVAERKIRPTDAILVKMTTLAEGPDGMSPFGGFTTPEEGRVIQLGRGSMPEEFEREVVKLSVGTPTHIEFDVPNMAAGPNGETVTVHAVSDITVLELRREVLPAMDSAWVAEHYPSDGTYDQMRDRIKRQITDKKMRGFLQMAPQVVASMVTERLDGEIPEEAIEEGLKRYSNDFDRFLMKQETTREEYLVSQGITEDQFNDQLRQEVVGMVATDLALLAYADEKGLEPTEVEVDAVFGMDDPQSTTTARERAKKYGYLDQIRTQARRMKALEQLAREACYMSYEGVVDDHFKAELIDALDQQAREKKIHASREAVEADMEKSE